MTFDIADIGTVDLSADTAFTTAEAAFYDSSGTYSASTASLQGIERAVNTAIAARTSGPRLRANSLKLYYYTPNTVADFVVGKVISVGSIPSFRVRERPRHHLQHGCARDQPLPRPCSPGRHHDQRRIFADGSVSVPFNLHSRSGYRSAPSHEHGALGSRRAKAR